MPDYSSRGKLPPAKVKLLLVLLFVFWSNSFTAIKHLREIFEPMELVLARFLPVSVFCLVYLLASTRRRRESLVIMREHPLRLGIMALTGVAGYNFFLFLGQSEVKPGAAALITTLVPLLTLILAIVFLRERVPGRRIIGILLAFTGLYFTVRYGRVGMGRMTGISHAELKYAALTALAPTCWSIYTIAGKELVKRYQPLTVTYLALVLGILPLLPLLGGGFFTTAAHLPPTGWIALFHLSALCTVVGFYVWVLGLRNLPATTVASFVYLNPPFAAFFGWLIFGEEVTSLFLLGGAVVLFGLYLAQRGDTKKGLPASAGLR